ncbi:hypothetical protein [Nocardia wallacei]|uniref:hypothetical protein n=1 Tax=Nocardia wallacei TaxID=480035 RepID=UPI002456C302|nr:hypothetical protein [Nocardia wallacei]
MSAGLPGVPAPAASGVRTAPVTSTAAPRRRRSESVSGGAVRAGRRRLIFRIRGTPVDEDAGT